MPMLCFASGMPLKEFEAITLKPKYRGTLGDKQAIAKDATRTPGKDEVAEYIVAEVIPDRWPMNMTDLADETGYSRQHVSNVVIEYFEGVDEDDINEGENGRGQPRQQQHQQTQPTATSSVPETVPDTVFAEIDGQYQEIEIAVPDDADRGSYIRGYLEGLQR